MITGLFGKAKIKGDRVFGFGNVRLSGLLTEVFKQRRIDFKDYKTVLDIGCGDGMAKNSLLDLNYLGLDIGAGCYPEVEDDSIKYIRNRETLEQAALDNKSDLVILINVLEHTEDFDGLFVVALKSCNKSLVVSLPNEFNIHLRLSFLFGNGINSHGLEMWKKHLNNRHLWLIDPTKAEAILTDIASSHGFTLVDRFDYIALPTTKWKRVIYRILILFLPMSMASRNFTLVYDKK